MNQATRPTTLKYPTQRYILWISLDQQVFNDLRDIVFVMVAAEKSSTSGDRQAEAHMRLLCVVSLMALDELAGDRVTCFDPVLVEKCVETLLEHLSISHFVVETAIDCLDVFAQNFSLFLIEPVRLIYSLML
jgi:hypothetical protein